MSGYLNDQHRTHRRVFSSSLRRRRLVVSNSLRFFPHRFIAFQSALCSPCTAAVFTVFQILPVDLVAGVLVPIVGPSSVETYLEREFPFVIVEIDIVVFFGTELTDPIHGSETIVARQHQT